jgi:hypothetical protein
VSPWQFGISPENALNYIIKNGPAYQLDFGEVKRGISWPSDACEIYVSEDNGFQLCIENDQGTNQLIAGELAKLILKENVLILTIQFRLAYVLYRSSKFQPL